MTKKRFKVIFHHMTKKCERWQDGDLLKVYEAEHEIPRGLRICPACTVLSVPMGTLCLASHFEDDAKDITNRRKSKKKAVDKTVSFRASAHGRDVGP
jgi:hypothetical protein